MESKDFSAGIRDYGSGYGGRTSCLQAQVIVVVHAAKLQAFGVPG